ncbi:PfaB family protein [Anthocerotibacter panamensis]|uniref:PfaB family protein n=1 Tax=Anthocerotibacter panamensis TaxID=2857077 RepID=UPI001C4061C3|nr:PfaB family protein [Anthocerotibacter panamensis]
MEEIAVIGLGCLFPGATDPEQFWQNLLAGRDSRSPATAQDFGADPSLFFDPEKGKADRCYYLKGGFIRNFHFTATGYQLPAEFLARLDPLYQWSLSVAKQALQDSGYPRSPGSLERCGLVLASLSLPTRSSYDFFAPFYHSVLESTLQEVLDRKDFNLTESVPTPLPQNALVSGYTATVVARALGLGGLSYALDAACASSLYAIDLACRSLQFHQSDLMLAGAVNAAHPLLLAVGFSQIQSHPDNQISQPLCRSSRGLTVAEGAGMLVLKRYSDALRDGDRVWAVIRGIGLANDGRGRHLLAPNPRGQRLAFMRAYAGSHVSPQQVQYVECHATGTPLGDGTELNSIASFFGSHGGRPWLGAVKANVGHLMSAAGMAGVLKTILSLNRGTLPATPGIQTTPGPKTLAGQILDQAQPWIGFPRLGAVNSFGFGGTNAHLVLEQDRGTQVNPVQRPALSGLAIVGMDVHFGPCDGLAAFERTIYEGEQHFIPLPPQRWQGIDTERQLLEDYGLAQGSVPRGAYLADFDFDVLQFRTPLEDIAHLNPQQLLMLRVADRALQDAGLSKGAAVAVVIATGTELSLHRALARYHLPQKVTDALAQAGWTSPQPLTTLVQECLHPTASALEYVGMIGNILASRISSHWDFTGPAFTLLAEEHSAFKALECARLLLSTGEFEAVLVGAVDLAGGAEQVLLHHQLTQLTESPVGPVGEGAAAVVLKRPADARQANKRIYAVIDAIAAMSEPTDHPEEEAALACRHALAEAGVDPSWIGYIETCGRLHTGGLGLAQVYQTRPGLTCALGSVQANIGYTHAAAGLAGLVKTALCLYHRYLVAGPSPLPLTPDSPFYVPEEAQPWLLSSTAPIRVAALHGSGMDGACVHLILREEPQQVDTLRHRLDQQPLYLFPLSAQDQAELLAQLQGLQQTLTQGLPLPDLARQCYGVYRHRKAAYSLVLVAGDDQALGQQIQRALKGLPGAFAQKKDWKTPQGSYFSANPLGGEGNVAFVYPGAFNSYLGLGRTLLRLFPEGHRHLERMTNDPSGLLHEHYLYPRSQTPLTALQREEQEERFSADAVAMLESGIGFSVLCTALLGDYFGLRPQAAFGYSLGETSMFYALGIWDNIDASSARLRASPLLRTHLSGPKILVRAHWKLACEQGPDWWRTYVVMAPAPTVCAQVKAESRVYITHINTTEEVVIVGERQACERVIARLGCDTFQAPAHHVLHCDPMQGAYAELAALNTLPLGTVPPVTFYSSATYQPVPLDSQALGQTIGQGLCQQVDFPRLVRQVWEDGARIFVELGAGSTCSRWISEILQGQEHVTVSINKRGSDDHTSLIQLLAKLVAHQVPLDLSPLYPPPSPPAPRTLLKTVTLGGARIRDTLLARAASLKVALQVSASQPATSTESPIMITFQPPLTAQQPTPAALTAQPQASPTTYEGLHSNLMLATQAHITFLRSRNQSLQQLGALLMMHLDLCQEALQADHPEAVPEQSSSVAWSRSR